MLGSSLKRTLTLIPLSQAVPWVVPGPLPFSQMSVTLAVMPVPSQARFFLPLCTLLRTSYYVRFLVRIL